MDKKSWKDDREPYYMLNRAVFRYDIPKTDLTKVLVMISQELEKPKPRRRWWQFWKWFKRTS